MKEKILPCPFCGGYKVDICRTNPQACWVECSYCGARCQSHRFRKEAIRIWNVRLNVNGYATIENDDDREIKNRSPK